MKTCLSLLVPIALTGLVGGAQAAPVNAAQIQAAVDTANGASCNNIRPFYWEVGDSAAMKVAGSVGGTTFTQSTPIAVASASKWIYGAYVWQARSGALNNADRQYLTFRSGYNNFGSCSNKQTVSQCADSGNNAELDAATVGKFDYGGGHMQQHAQDFMGLGSMDPRTLTTVVNTALGTKGTYMNAQVAGAISTTAADYAQFLRKLMTNQLVLGAHLGESAVCTNKRTCPDAIYAPFPSSESWHYSTGHWVEDDPVVGDGAFSSPGAFGFYPWISADRQTYGIVARKTPAAAWDSVGCGRLIRKAFATAKAM